MIRFYWKMTITGPIAVLHYGNDPLQEEDNKKKLMDPIVIPESVGEFISLDDLKKKFPCPKILEK